MELKHFSMFNMYFSHFLFPISLSHALCPKNHCSKLRGLKVRAKTVSIKIILKYEKRNVSL